MDISRIALLVDDEPVSRAAQQARLEGEGYTVFVAQNQADALSRAKLSPPKIIFVHLVGASSVPLIQALRSDDVCRHVPVVVLKEPSYVSKVSTKLHAIPHDSW
jgi:CheY-like chemotaxis protein